MSEEYLPCSKRLDLVQFNLDGSKDRVQQCSEQSADRANQIVSPADCDACTVRRAVIRKEAERKPHKSPEKISVRVKSTTPEVHAQYYPPCLDRLKGVVSSCCGATEYVRICNSMDAYQYGAEVSPIICEQCPARRF